MPTPDQDLRDALVFAKANEQCMSEIAIERAKFQSMLASHPIVGEKLLGIRLNRNSDATIRHTFGGAIEGYDGIFDPGLRHVTAKHFDRLAWKCQK